MGDSKSWNERDVKQKQLSSTVCPGYTDNLKMRYTAVLSSVSTISPDAQAQVLWYAPGVPSWSRQGPFPEVSQPSEVETLNAGLTEGKPSTRHLQCCRSLTEQAINPASAVLQEHTGAWRSWAGTGFRRWQLLRRAEGIGKGILGHRWREAKRRDDGIEE